MSTQAARERVLGEVGQAGRLAPSTKRVMEGKVASYERWCEANAEEAWPATEELILMYLHSHYPNWSYNHARQVASALRRHNEAQSGTRETNSAEVSAYLLTLRKTFGTSKKRQTDALTKGEIQEIASHADDGAKDSKELSRLRALVAVAHALGVNPCTAAGLRAVVTLPTSAFTTSDRAIMVRTDQQRGILDADKSTLLFEYLSRHLEDAGDSSHPLINEITAVRDDVYKCASAVARALYPRNERNRLNSLTQTVAAQAWANADEEDFALVAEHLDTQIARRWRDTALFLHGVATGHRYAELSTLTLDDMLPTSTGYTYTVTRHKGALLSEAGGGIGEPIRAGLDHLEDAPANCPSHCPACAVGRHIRQRMRDGAQGSEPLYAGQKGEPLGWKGAFQAINKLWTGIESTPQESQADRIIGTRSMRVTAATLARQAGMNYLEIAEQVTHHRNVKTAELYVRRHDAWSNDLTLPLRN